MDFLLKRDENESGKHLVHKTDKWCVLHVAFCKQAIGLFTVGEVSRAEFDKLDEENYDHITYFAMSGKVYIEWTDGREREITTRLRIESNIWSQSFVFYPIEWCRQSES